MITIIGIFWMVSFRYRVRPNSGDQHAHGTLNRHIVVDDGGVRWHCQTCPRANDYSPPLSGADWALTVLLAALTGLVLYADYRIGMWL